MRSLAFSVASEICPLEVLNSFIRGKVHIPRVALMKANRSDLVLGSMSVSRLSSCGYFCRIVSRTTEVVRMSRIKYMNDVWNAASASHIASKNFYETQKFKRIFNLLMKENVDR